MLVRALELRLAAAFILTRPEDRDIARPVYWRRSGVTAESQSPSSPPFGTAAKPSQVSRADGVSSVRRFQPQATRREILLQNLALQLSREASDKM